MNAKLHGGRAGGRAGEDVRWADGWRTGGAAEGGRAADGRLVQPTALTQNLINMRLIRMGNSSVNLEWNKLCRCIKNDAGCK